MPQKTSNDQALSFEDAIKELESIVSSLEKGDATLEQSLKLFKRGVELVEFCNKKLTEAQGVVTILSRSKSGELYEADFETDERELR